MPPNQTVERFRSAGWGDLPLPSASCSDCVARVGKKAGGRSIEVMVHDSDYGIFMLEASFYE